MMPSMPVDAFSAARRFVTLAELSERAPVWQSLINDEIRANEAFDASRAARRVYGDDTDLIPIHAIARFADVDSPMQAAERRFPLPSQLTANDADPISLY